ncbi:MAG: glycosyltransferase family 1 protein [Patescibacteria group bacterium]|jgi:glycosyltransferase involved in cell wall biosynthesis
MKIGIDARFFGSASKGLGRYTEQLIRNLEILDPQHDFVVFMRSQDWDVWTPKNPRFSKVKTDVNWYSIEEQTRLPSIIKAQGCDLVHYPHFNVPLRASRPFISTVHDLILSHFPTVKATTLGPLVYWFKHQMYKRVIQHALKNSLRVITVSQYTKADIEKTFHIPNGKIVVTYEGVDTRPLDVLMAQHSRNVHGDYLLYVGNAYPHKNLERLVDAFAIIQKSYPKLSLVLVGKHDFFYTRLMFYVKQRGIQRVVFPGFVPDAELGSFYAHSKGYVFPSLYEGFGLPPLEAMAHDVPVACSNSSCLPEVLGDAAVYFSPEHIDDMIHGMEKILSDSFLRQELIQKGRQQVTRYSWQRMALETLRIYELSL